MLQKVSIAIAIITVNLLSGCEFYHNILGEAIKQNACKDINNTAERMECEKQANERLDYYKNKNKKNNQTSN